MEINWTGMFVLTISLWGGILLREEAKKSIFLRIFTIAFFSIVCFGLLLYRNDTWENPGINDVLLLLLLAMVLGTITSFLSTYTPKEETEDSATPE